MLIASTGRKGPTRCQIGDKKQICSRLLMEKELKKEATSVERNFPAFFNENQRFHRRHF
jgi:hypothetical protein